MEKSVVLKFKKVTDFENDYSLVQPEDEFTMRVCGIYLENCLSHSSDFNCEDIFFLFHKDKVRVAMEIIDNDVMQCHGKKNSPPNKTQIKLLKNWLNSQNMDYSAVYYFEESYNQSPQPVNYHHGRPQREEPVVTQGIVGRNLHIEVANPFADVPYDREIHAEFIGIDHGFTPSEEQVALSGVKDNALSGVELMSALNPEITLAIYRNLGRGAGKDIIITDGFRDNNSIYENEKVVLFEQSNVMELSRHGSVTEFMRERATECWEIVKDFNINPFIDLERFRNLLGKIFTWIHEDQRNEVLLKMIDLGRVVESIKSGSNGHK